ncbi:aldolase/citrate lyase family protein [Congregibacter variabilis]|uniref:Aldolase/citrate lyase family protein n=1 Tax=Congregibacter variabilis TaxID=3081200 RepID=A0ABZ0I5C3_9GAMM|nr:aldolase/citrate lyase family protein [Congregibacter sp. IMCC43200]
MKNQIIEKWQSEEKSRGAWSNLPDIHIAETLARSGLDWICFDLQHGLMDYSHLTQLLPAITGLPITPVVRVAANQPDQIGKALDAGARGVIVPMINSAEDARQAVAACYYPPKGLRSCGPMRDAMVEGLSYLGSANEDIACLLMIETEEGLSNLEAIAAVPGVTGLFVGPMDLTYGLGLAPGDFSNDRFNAALQKIMQACRSNRLACGMFGYNAEMAAESLEQGFDFVSIGSDISMLRDGLAQALTTAKAEVKSSEPSRGGY